MSSNSEQKYQCARMKDKCISDTDVGTDKDIKECIIHFCSVAANPIKFLYRA